MVSQQPQLSPAMEMLLGTGATPSPGASGAPMAPTNSGVVSPAVASLLTGDPAPVSPTGEGEAQGLVPPSPMSDAIPPQNPPPGVVPTAAGSMPAVELGDPSRGHEADITEDFYRRHGRAPTTLDMQAIRAMPVLERVLGRPPRRIEMLQHLAGRAEQQQSPPLQFQPISTTRTPGAADLQVPQTDGVIGG